MRIRPAETQDAEALLRLIQDHALYENGKAMLPGDVLLALLDQPEPPVRIWVAEAADGTLAGYAALTFDYALWSGARFGYLDCLFVAADQRGLRIGDRLFQTVSKAARGAGAVRLEWQTPNWNEGAVRFYLRQGAVAQPKQRFYLSWE